MHKNILVLDGHPAAHSISRQWSLAYADAAGRAGHTVRVRHLADIQFDTDFGEGDYTDHKPLEPVLEDALCDFEWADHVVMAMPMWWGGLPAKLKGFFDRAFLPGRTFDTRSKTFIGLPRPLLTGKTGRIMISSDTPGFFQRLVYRSAIQNQLKGQIFGFVGIRPIRFTSCNGASEPRKGVVDRWLAEAGRLGSAAA